MTKRQRWIALILAALAALVMACTSSTPETPILSPSPVAKRAAISLAFDKLQVDLGTIPNDLQGIETFVAINWGNKPLKVGPVNLQVEQGCPLAGTAFGTVEVRPKEMALLPIWFGPHQQLGPHRIKATISSTDPLLPQAALTLHFVVSEGETVQAKGPRLRLDKGYIDIGTVPYDWPLYEQFTLRNGGDAPLILQGMPTVRVLEGC